MSDRINSTLLGLAIGDALGVPVEFTSREVLRQNPVTDYREFGTHTQQAGTFSDDASLCFCLVESLIEGYSVDNLAQKMVAWRYDHYWTAGNYAFDCGLNISIALEKLRNNHSPKFSGNYTEKSNSNGSLMRILPLAFYTKDKPLEFRYRMVKEVSTITHAHDRTILACFYLVEYATELLTHNSIAQAWRTHNTNFIQNCEKLNIGKLEMPSLSRILDDNFPNLPESQISSSGYVVHTLEASIWCLLNTDSYAEAVLKAVNLGDDTDTVGCITGGLAGLFYGIENIPDHWIQQLRRNEDISNLADRFVHKLSQLPVG